MKKKKESEVSLSGAITYSSYSYDNIGEKKEGGTLWGEKGGRGKSVVGKVPYAL